MNLSSFKRILKASAASVCYRSGITALCARAANPPWRILMYHRVINPGDEYYPLQPGMYVTPETFAIHAAYLKENANVVALDELIQMIDKGETIPPKTVSITFDDGWRDNYDNAFPILREHELPATIFLATAFIDTEKMFWTDELALNAGILWANKGEITPDFFEAAGVSKEAGGKLVHFFHQQTQEEFGDELDCLIEKLKNAPSENREKVIEIFQKLARPFEIDAKQRRFLSWDEVKEMDENGLSFGSHTHTHQPLTSLSPTQMKEELTRASSILKERVDKPSAAFCYPGGYWSAETQQVLADMKLQCVITTDQGINKKENPQQLGRISIHNDVSYTTTHLAGRIWNPLFS